MLRTTVSLFALLIAASLTACNRATPTPPINNTPTRTADAYPYPAATSIPQTATAYPEPDAIAPPAPVQPLIISQTVLNCAAQNNRVRCYDETLQIEFERPPVWGEIEAVLREGGDAGYAYEYRFTSQTVASEFPLMAGGRSKDFTEGRGGIFTDFRDYGDNYSSQNRCHDVQAYRPICEEIQTNVVLLMGFPDAHSICEMFPGGIFTPIIFIEINLPANATINGFVFVTHFLSDMEMNALVADMRDILGYDLATGDAAICGDADQEAFDRRMVELVQRIENGQIDDQTKENIAQLREMAESITFR
jgi:hypothetical protein